MRALSILLVLALTACATPKPDTSQWRPVVITCQWGNGHRTCTSPQWVFSSGQTYNRKGCTDKVADYNRHRPPGVKTPATCGRV